MKLDPAEPAATQWRTITLDTLWEKIRTDLPDHEPLIVAIDGRGASGKSTLADALAGMLSRTVVVHTDDLAWNELLFDWARLLREGILEPVRAQRPVRFTPPAWRAHGRQGAIEIPSGTAVLIVEGVGAAHASVEKLLDSTIWVQADRDEAERRGIERDLASGVNGDQQATVAFWHEWSEAEREYLARDRPWERAGIIVAGTPPLSSPPAPTPPPGTIAVAEGPLHS